MRKILYYILPVLFLASCHGTIDDTLQGADDDQPQEVPEEFVGPYTLSADKTEVEASGEDYVTFSLTDAYGRDVLLDRKALQTVNIISDSGIRVARMETSIRFISNGTYSFTAKYQGEESANSVSIKAANRGKYEKFHKNVAIYKATATWCGPCAVMTKALEGMDDDTKNHSVELCWHGDDDLAINPVSSTSNDGGGMILSAFGSSGFPTVVLDLQKVIMEKSSGALENAIWELRADFPATSGIKVSTSASDGILGISAELMTSTGGGYDLGCAILLNNQVIPEGTNEGGKYSHIVRASTGNFLMYSDLCELEKDGTMTMEQEVELEGDLKDYSIVVFSLVKHADGARIDNIVEVPAGESIDYVYNE